MVRISANIHLRSFVQWTPNWKHSNCLLKCRQILTLQTCAPPILSVRYSNLQSVNIVRFEVEKLFTTWINNTSCRNVQVTQWTEQNLSGLQAISEIGSSVHGLCWPSPAIRKHAARTPSALGVASDQPLQYHFPEAEVVLQSLSSLFSCP